MRAPGWPVTFLLFGLLSSATSSPVSMHTPAPPLPSQISAPSPLPTFLPSLPSPSLSIPPALPPISGNPRDAAAKAHCPLTLSPSTLVVRFGDPFTANCSVSKMEFFLLGWEVQMASPEPTMNRFLVWRVDRMTEWNVEPMCYAVSNLGGNCHLNLSVIVYKPPDTVSISFANHTGPMTEHRQYHLQCTVQDVAPVGDLVVTFYRGQTMLGRRRSGSTEKTPVNETFALNIKASRGDDGAQYWCEAELQLKPEGGPPQQQPLVVKSRQLRAAVFFGPQLLCPAKLQVRVGEALACEVRGNPEPSVTWLKDGRVVVPPANASARHAGKYTVTAVGHTGQKSLAVEVEVLAGRGNSSTWNRCSVLAVPLILMLNLLS